MLKNKSMVLTFILIVFAAFYLTNCDDDDSPTKPGTSGGGETPPEIEELLGTWEVTNIHITIPGIVDTAGAPSDSFFTELGMPNQIFVTFLEDSVNQAVLIWADSTDTVSGTWSVSGNQLTTSMPILEQEQVVTGTYALSEDKNTMTFSTTIVAEYAGFMVQIPATLTLVRRE
jgi:hypothetical protein